MILLELVLYLLALFMLIVCAEALYLAARKGLFVIGLRLMFSVLVLSIIALLVKLLSIRN